MPTLANAARAVSLVAGLGIAACGASNASPPPVVQHVDLDRYLGLWHEMARYENRFQGPDCLNVTAQYSLRDDGDISVLNTCRDAAGNVAETADGRAYVADKSTNAKLRVTFFWPFFGDYWIVALADDYAWAIVSDPSREYLWILTREPLTGGPLKDELIARAASLGFDTARLVYARTTPR